MARKLARNVNVNGVLYGPDGETPSKEIADQITNPKAWEAEDDSVPTLESDPAVQDDDESESTPKPAKKVAAKKAAASSGS